MRRSEKVDRDEYVRELATEFARKQFEAEERAAETRDNKSFAGGDSLVPGALNSVGPTVGDFQRMCCVWRIGSVLDTCSGMTPYKCATLNVVVEEWLPEVLGEEYNRFFGKSLYLGTVEQYEYKELIAAARRLLKQNGKDSNLDSYLVATLRRAHAGVQEWMRVDGIDLGRVATDVREWRAVDEAYREDKDVLTMRWETAEPNPGDPDTRTGMNGERVDRPALTRPRPRDVTSELRVAEDVARRTGILLYEPASPDSSALWQRGDDNKDIRNALFKLQKKEWKMSTIGRVASLVDGINAVYIPSPEDDKEEKKKKGEAWTSDRQLIRLADEMHTHWMGVRAVVNFWREATDQKEWWPILNPPRPAPPLP
mgnify:CR=1 FL=1